MWSSGAVLGGLIGAAAIYLGISPTAQLSASAVLFGAVCLTGYRFLLRGPDHDESQIRAEEGAGARSNRSVYGVLAALVVVAIAGAVVEDAGGSWASLYLRDSLSAPAALAAFGYVGLVGFQFVGRVLDRMVDRWGACAVARAGGLLIAVGMAVALAFPSIPGTIAGFAAAGFGSATLVPGAMHAADDLPGLRPGTGLTVLTWLMRVGFLGSPIIVGAIADAVSLRVGLLAVPVSGLAAVLLARALSPRNRSARS